VCGQLGQIEAAGRALSTLLEQRPDIGDAPHEGLAIWWQTELVEHLVAGLRKAGLTGYWHCSLCIGLDELQHFGMAAQMWPRGKWPSRSPRDPMEDRYGRLRASLTGQPEGNLNGHGVHGVHLVSSLIGLHVDCRDCIDKVEFRP
jgi:hypothetical protein